MALGVKISLFFSLGGLSNTGMAHLGHTNIRSSFFSSVVSSSELKLAMENLGFFVTLHMNSSN
jgi:hypothetical protein